MGVRRVVSCLARNGFQRAALDLPVPVTGESNRQLTRPASAAEAEAMLPKT